MSNHTQEPWTEKTAILLPAYDDRVLVRGKRLQVASRVLSEPNYQRAMTCVNACTEINPNWVRALIDATTKYLDHNSTSNRHVLRATLNNVKGA